MNFTGTELIHQRSFFTQTGNLGVSAECAINATTGIFYVGVSGEAGILEWKLFNGKIFYGNLFIGSYQPYQTFLFDIQTTTGHLNNKVNNVPVYYGQSRATGYFDHVYFRREDPTLEADFQFNVSGNNFPLYSLSPYGYLTSSGQNGATGYFIDQSSFPINVFNSKTYDPQNLVFSPLIASINGGGTGSFSYNGDFTSFDFTQPILTTFNTNFGDLSIFFSVVDLVTYNTFVLFNPTITDFSFNAANILNRTLAYNNYSGGQTTNNFNTNLFFSLQFITGQLPTPGWEGGALTGFFSGQGSGLASGLGFTGVASGGMTGLLTGYDYAGSGQFSVNEWTTGYGLSSVVILPSVYATGYVDLTSVPSMSLLQFASGAPIIFNLGPMPITPNSLCATLSGNPSSYSVNGVVRNNWIIDLTAITGGSQGNGLQIEELMGAAGMTGSNWYKNGAGDNVVFLTGGSGLAGGIITVFPISTYTGTINQSLSGIYVTGLKAVGGFTGNWDVLTGVDSSSLFSIKTAGNYTATMISGSGVFPPNSSMNFQFSHLSTGHDTVQLIVSGSQVINPINQQLYN